MPEQALRIGRGPIPHRPQPRASSTTPTACNDAPLFSRTQQKQDRDRVARLQHPAITRKLRPIH